MNCYERFAELYDRLIHEDIDYHGFSNKILELCQEYKINYDNYLDLACGTGNISILVAPNFKNTYLIDSSNDMLMQADKKFRKNKLKCRLVLQDMCNLQLNKKFDLITCVLDSTNYIIEETDLKTYFLKVKEHLNPGGLFVFDINSYYKISEIMGNNIFTYDDDEIFYSWQNSFSEDVLEMYLTFFIKNKEGLYERFDEEHTERAYKDSYIEKVLKECGFTIEKKLNNYSDNAIDFKTERIVYITK